MHTLLPPCVQEELIAASCVNPQEEVRLKDGTLVRGGNEPRNVAIEKVIINAKLRYPERFRKDA